MFSKRNFTLLALSLTVSAAVAQSYGDFRSISSGEWNNAGIWETYNGSEWEAAIMYPSSTDGQISVVSGHEIVLTSDEIIDELNVEGKLILSNKRIMLLDGNIKVNGSLDIKGRLMCSNNVIAGEGTFSLSEGATILIGSAEGITSSGNSGNIQTLSRTFSANAHYVYCGTEAQVTGNGLPTAALNGTLTLDNEKGCSLTGSLTINNQLVLKEGVFCLNGNTLTMNNGQAIAQQNGTLNLCGGNVAAVEQDVKVVSPNTLVAGNNSVSDNHSK
jgi:hypothetical protein